MFNLLIFYFILQFTQLTIAKNFRFALKGNFLCTFKKFNLKFPKFRIGGKWYGNYPRNSLKNGEIIEFPESEPFNQKYTKENRI